MGKYFSIRLTAFIIAGFIGSLNSQTLDDRINNIINQMTLDEKILQLHHEGGFNTADNLRFGIQGFVMADGPHGVRDGNATCFPVGISMAATWDTELIYRVGIAMGKEFKGKGKHQALGPCMDLTKDPRNGRSPESGGEDPFLCAQITTSLIKGIQSTGCIATAKHYNADSRQDNRFNNNYIISQRNLMEHLGLNYRTAVQDGGVMCVMNAYNLINGQKCAENYNLLTTILRNTWGFPFYVVSDWGSIWNTKSAVEAGCNIEMGSDYYQNELLNLVNGGQVSITVIDDALRKVLKTKILAGMFDYFPPGNPDDVNSIEHQQLSLEAARKSIILLKNEGNILPLNIDTITTLAIVGPSASTAQIDGSGSSYVTPFYSVSPNQGIFNKIGSEKVVYAKGCDINSTDTSGFGNAINLALSADVVIFFGGLDQSQEGEGFDRVGGSTSLPGKQQDLINRLSSVNPNIIVVLESGGICTIQNCIDNIKGLLYAFYPGQEGGNALADVIFGDYNPGGKLPVTMPVNDSQLPARNFDFNDDYGCGYRWFDEQNLIPQFAFGFGLSYTQFQYSNLTISPSSASAGDRITVTADVTNIGSRTGEEVIQLYISDTSSAFYMPVKQLKGFKRISLLPAETKTVTFEITSEELYYFDEAADRYKVDPGIFIVRIGGSSGNLPLSGTFELLASELKPDLKISWIKSSPPYPVKGDTVLLLAAIRNQGTGVSPQGTVHKVIFKVNGSEVSSSTEFSNEILPAGMQLVSANIGLWIAQAAGTYPVEAVVDPDNSIAECLEDNNSYSTAIEVINQPAVNLSLNKTVFVSSIEGAGLEGPKAVDGNKGTRWSSSFSDPQYIYVDLGSVQHINQIDLYWETAYADEYEIQTSNDASLWNTLVHITNSDGGIDRISISADARYVRMYGIHRATQWGYSLYEFEIYNIDSSSSGFQTRNKTLPSRYSLGINYPNPFNPSTRIRFSVPERSDVYIEIYNITGQLVKILTDKPYEQGIHEIEWDGKESSGKDAASGMYIYKMKAGDFIQAKKMILIR